MPIDLTANDLINFFKLKLYSPERKFKKQLSSTGTDLSLNRYVGVSNNIREETNLNNYFYMYATCSFLLNYLKTHHP